MGCFDKGTTWSKLMPITAAGVRFLRPKERREPPITTTTFASDLDALPGSNKKKRKSKLQPGEAQRDLGLLSLAQGGKLGENRILSMFG